MKKSCGERKTRERKLKVDVGSKCTSQGPLRQLQPNKTQTANTYQTPYFDIRPLGYAWSSTGSPSSPAAGHAYTDTLIKFKQRTKNDTKNTEERLTQCRSLSSLFASFPAPHVFQSYVIHFFVSQSNLQDCTTCPPLSSTSSFQCTRLF